MMEVKLIPIQYGDSGAAQACELCFELRIRFGYMVDPNGHTWRICADCINSLWEDKQSVNQAHRTEEERRQIAMEVLGEAIANLANTER